MSESVKTATISRVVPGRMVYVTGNLTGDKGSYAFNLDRIEVRESDGSLRPYRGEPMSEIGLNVGQSVCVLDDPEPVLVVDSKRAKTYGFGGWKFNLRGMFGAD